MVDTSALEAIFRGSVKLKSDESCLIITDTLQEHIGWAFVDFAKTITDKVKITVIAPANEHAQEPPTDAALEMLEYDVQFLITSKSLSHTKARKAASAKGARIASMPGVTEDMINRCCAINCESLKQRSQKLHKLLSQASLIRVTTLMGTNITFTKGDSDWFGQNGGSFDFPGAFGNLPEGEVSFSPAACEGKYIVDASFPDMGILEEPILFEVKNGSVVRITGVRSDEIRARLDAVGPQAYKVAELGIGLNEKACIIGNVLEDEKVMGTVHIALGNNISYGGDNDVPLHLDGVIRDPDIFVDDKKIMQNGEFLGVFEEDDADV